MAETECLFCRIARGEIPSHKVYEDEATLVFRDIAPKAPVHLLVIPREHYESVHTIPSGQLAAVDAVFAAVRKVVELEKLTEKGYRLVINAGADAGQAVPHLHVHILAGRKLDWPPG